MRLTQQRVCGLRRCKTLYLPTPPFFTRPGTMKKPGTISIKEVATAEALEQAQQIRAQVLEAEQGFPHEVNIDGRDPAASHLLMLDEDAPVATARRR